jgi:hypothetical protein
MEQRAYTAPILCLPNDQAFDGCGVIVVTDDDGDLEVFVDPYGETGDGVEPARAEWAEQNFGSLDEVHDYLVDEGIIEGDAVLTEQWFGVAFA